MDTVMKYSRWRRLAFALSALTTVIVPASAFALPLPWTAPWTVAFPGRFVGNTGAATLAAFGTAAGTIRSDKDVTDMMREGIRAIAPYIVFVFFAAHFVAMFNWSRIGPIIAINGAEALQTLALPAPLLLVSVQLLGSFLDLFIGSASAKWSALAPVVVPMFMLLGISPEMTTAAYRMGDSTVNMASPLNPYFPLILGFCQRWKPGFGVGGLIAAVLPYSFAFMIAGLLLTGAWAVLELPTGPGSPFHYAAPGAR